MNDMNRILIFLLLAGLLYALYRYQHKIFGNFEEEQQSIQKTTKYIKQNKIQTKTKKLPYENKTKKVSIDNISQLSLGSLEDENGNAQVYKQDSILGSLDSNSFITERSNDSLVSKNDSLFQ